MAKPTTEECQMDMTPMIDVVFQLIIFFVVTLKMTADFNKDIILEDGKHGITLTHENQPPSTFEIEVDRRGNISVHNARFSKAGLLSALKARVAKHGTEFPCMIRADYRTQHSQVKEVMDSCGQAGIWKLSFVAIQEHKAKAGSKK